MGKRKINVNLDSKVVFVVTHKNLKKSHIFIYLFLCTYSHEQERHQPQLELTTPSEVRLLITAALRSVFAFLLNRTLKKNYF